MSAASTYSKGAMAMTRVLLTDFFWADSRLSAHRVEIRKSSRSATDPRANCPFLATLLTMWTFGAGGLSPCDALSLHEHTSHATRLRKTHPARPRLGGKPSVLGYDLACPRPSEGDDYPGTAWPRAGSRTGRQRYVRRGRRGAWTIGSSKRTLQGSTWSAAPWPPGLCSRWRGAVAPAQSSPWARAASGKGGSGRFSGPP